MRTRAAGEGYSLFDSKRRKQLCVGLWATIMISTFLGCDHVLAQSADQSKADPAHLLKIKKSFLKSPKFILGPDTCSIYTFWGLGYTTEATALLEQYPPALREARKALPYSAMSLGGSIALLALVAKNFLVTLQKAKDVSDNEWIENSFKVGDMIMIGAAGAITIVGGLTNAHHLKKSVRMYNHREDRNPGSEYRQAMEAARKRQSRHNRFTLVSGINSSWLGGSSHTELSSRPGVQLGLVSDYKIRDRVGFRTGAVLSSRGYQSTPEPSSSSTSSIARYRHDMAYIEIPALIVLTPWQNRYEPHVTLGPSLALNIASGITSSTIEDHVPDSKARALGFGLSFGAGASIPDSPLGISVRHYMGLRNPLRDATHLGDAKMNCTSLTISCKL